MRSVQRFSSFDELKAADGHSASMATVLKRHRAFERLIAAIRDRLVRKSGRSRR
jgi:hypothetical protein